jgi:toxin ParE1/3/4
MPSIVRWTKNAVDGLVRVHTFLAKIDPDAAQKALDAIETGADLLKQFPNAGRPADDLEPDHRELLIPFGGSGYALFYEVIGNVVLILAVKHQKEAGY